MNTFSFFQEKQRRELVHSGFRGHSYGYTWLRSGGLLVASLLCTQLQAQGQVAEPESLHFSDLAKTTHLPLPALDSMDGEPRQMTPPASGMSLLSLIERGLSTHPQLQQVLAQQQSAQAQRKVARADLLPSLTIRTATGPEQSQTAGSAVNNHRYNMNSLRMTQPEPNLLKMSGLAVNVREITTAVPTYQNDYPPSMSIASSFDRYYERKYPHPLLIFTKLTPYPGGHPKLA